MVDKTPDGTLLSGYRVLDLTEDGCQICGKVLGDMGADVIKVEPPGGSPTRKKGPFYHDDVHPEKSLFWMACNTSKRGITLDIEKTEGAALFKNLLTTADIVVENFPPGHMEHLGLGYADLCTVKPEVILTSITPFGQTGPLSHYKGSDIAVWAMGGMLGLCGDDDRPPVQHSHPQSYYHGGMQGAVGTMTALYHREMSGEGQHVDVSMQQAVTLTLMNAVEIGDLLNLTHPRPFPDGTYLNPRSEEYGPLLLGWRWECKDGHITWAQGLAGGAQQGMVRSTGEIVKWMEEDGVAGDLPEYDWSGFDTSTISQETVNHHIELFRPFFLTKTKREFMDRAASRGILLGAYQTTEDIAECPHLDGRDYFVDVEHPELNDTITYPGAWAKISKAPWRISRRAPLTGEHNEEIFEEELGITKAKISIYKNREII
jgi:crotonobetainyl-CoA:carnitine CoA-transferase CaiB-like acyl-CoA transferase